MPAFEHFQRLLGHFCLYAIAFGGCVLLVWWTCSFAWNLLRRWIRLGLVGMVVTALGFGLSFAQGGAKAPQASSGSPARLMAQCALQDSAGEASDNDVADHAVTTLCFRRFDISDRDFCFEAAWPEGMRFYDDSLILYASSDLTTNRWTEIATIDVRGRTDGVVFEMSRDDLPVELQQSAVFFRMTGDVLDGPVVEDSDGDGLSDLLEEQLGTNPLEADTDGDGLSDGDEVSAGLDPLDDDTDGDGLPDGEEMSGGGDPLFAEVVPNEPSGPHYEFVGENVYTTVFSNEMTVASAPAGRLADDGWVPRFGIEYDESWMAPYERQGVGSRFRALHTGYYTFQLEADDRATVAIGETVITAEYPDLGSPVTTFMREGEERAVTVSSMNRGGPARLRFRRIDYTPHRPIRLRNAFTSQTVYVERGRSRENFTLLAVGANGGDFGGTLAFETESLERLQKIFGMDLPSGTVAVGAGEFWWRGCAFRGRAPSVVPEDVKVIATFTENMTGDTLVVTASVTVVEIAEPPAIKSLMFDASAMFFENSYRNLPGEEMVPKRRQGAVLSYEISGGENGAFFMLDLQDGGAAVSIEPGLVPSGVLQAGPNQTVSGTIPFAPEEACVSVVVVLDVYDALTGFKRSRRVTIPVIQVELTALYDAPENDNIHRHVFGVGEKVRFRCYPEGVPVRYSAYRRAPSFEANYYDRFLYNDDIYVGPFTADRPSVARVIYGDSEYCPAIEFVEPQEIVTKGASWDGRCWPSGDVGQGVLVTTNYIGPMTVSFQGIMVAEIPCKDVVPPTGYFASSDFTGSQVHDARRGAGIAHRIKSGNYWCVDKAGGGRYQNWSAGRLDWKIPIGWFRLESDYDQDCVIDSVAHANQTGETSRALYIGGSDNAYHQIMSIDSSGTCRVEKFGHWLSRSQSCGVFLDGERLQWYH